MTIFANSNKSHKTAKRTRPPRHLQMHLQETQTIDSRCTLHTQKGILRSEIRPNKTRVIVTSTSRLVHTMTASLKISLLRFCLLQRLDRISRILLTNCLLNGSNYTTQKFLSWTALHIEKKHELLIFICYWTVMLFLSSSISYAMQFL